MTKPDHEAAKVAAHALLALCSGVPPDTEEAVKPMRAVAECYLDAIARAEAAERKVEELTKRVVDLDERLDVADRELREYNPNG